MSQSGSRLLKKTGGGIVRTIVEPPGMFSA
jgi:hypothetical protein